jgi:hypothetical protein
MVATECTFCQIKGFERDKKDQDILNGTAVLGKSAPEKI